MPLPTCQIIHSELNDRQAMVVMLLLLPMSLAWVRHRTYELFLVVHIVFSVVALVGCF